MNVFELALVLLWSGGQAAPPAGAVPRDSSDTRRVEVAAAAYMRHELPQGAIGFDNGVAPFAAPGAAPGSGSAGRGRELAMALGATLVRAAEAQSCPDSVPSHCRLTGKLRILLRIGAPVVQGDSAAVWVYTREALLDGRVFSVDSELQLRRERREWKVVGVARKRAS